MGVDGHVRQIDDGRPSAHLGRIWCRRHRSSVDLLLVEILRCCVRDRKRILRIRIGGWRVRCCNTKSVESLGTRGGLEFAGWRLQRDRLMRDYDAIRVEQLKQNRG